MSWVISIADSCFDRIYSERLGLLTRLSDIVLLAPQGDEVGCAIGEGLGLNGRSSSRRHGALVRYLVVDVAIGLRRRRRWHLQKLWWSVVGVVGKRVTGRENGATG